MTTMKLRYVRSVIPSAKYMIQLTFLCICSVLDDLCHEHPSLRRIENSYLGFETNICFIHIFGQTLID